MRAWSECAGFEWDEGNRNKNWEKHGVADAECEDVFFNRPLVVRQDAGHSSREGRRWRALGQTDRGRHLFIAFILRRNSIRVISAREMTRRERSVYMAYEKNEES